MNINVRNNLYKQVMLAIKGKNFSSSSVAVSDFIRDEETDDITGKFALIYVFDEEQNAIPFIISRFPTKIMITSPRYIKFKVVFEFNTETKGWSGMEAAGTLGEPDYVSVGDVMNNIRKITTIHLFDIP